MATTAQGHIPERRTGLFDRRSDSSSMHRSRMSALDWVAMVLLIIGGLNWGLVGLFNLDLVASLFGPMSTVSRAIYIVVGLCALWAIYTSTKMSQR